MGFIPQKHNPLHRPVKQETQNILLSQQQTWRHSPWTRGKRDLQTNKSRKSFYNNYKNHKEAITANCWCTFDNEMSSAAYSETIWFSFYHYKSSELVSPSFKWPVRKHLSGSVSVQRSFGFISDESTRLVQTYLPLSWSDRCLEPLYIWVHCGRREPRPGSGKESCFWHLVPSVSGNQGISTELKQKNQTGLLLLFLYSTVK